MRKFTPISCARRFKSLAQPARASRLFFLRVMVAVRAAARALWVRRRRLGAMLEQEKRKEPKKARAEAPVRRHEARRLVPKGARGWQKWVSVSCDHRAITQRSQCDHYVFKRLSLIHI